MSEINLRLFYLKYNVTVSIPHQAKSAKFNKQTFRGNVIMVSGIGTMYEYEYKYKHVLKLIPDTGGNINQYISWTLV